MSSFDVTKFHIGTTVTEKRKRADDSCPGGLTSFYKSPKAGDRFDTAQPVTISWNTACLSTPPNSIDIQLIAPRAANPQLYSWRQVNFAAGSYEATIKPKWFNYTSSIELQLTVTESNMPAFLTTIPMGPSFTAIYDNTTAPAANPNDVQSDEPPYQVVNNIYKGGGLSKGGLAAAVIMPILAVITALGVYVFWSRRREKVKRQRWSQAVDKRMSRISGDWKSISAAGASAAIRESMATGPGKRASSFYGTGRPSSAFAAEGGAPEMQLRPGLRASMLSNNRVSRVSFAADSVHSRPSLGDSLRPNVSTSTPTRAFHTAQPVPPIPAHFAQDIALSPTQTDGPISLSTDDIRSKLAKAADDEPRDSVDAEFARDAPNMPAMSLMRTGQTTTTDQDNDFILSPSTASTPEPTLQLPSPTYQPPTSPIGPMPMHTATLSPDEMLRAYAERARNGGPSTPTLASPASNNMRTLYAPPSVAESSATTVSRNDTGSNNPYRNSAHMGRSIAVSEMSRYSTDVDGVVGKAT